MNLKDMRDYQDWNSLSNLKNPFLLNLKKAIFE